jgi:hypothetical protein
MNPASEILPRRLWAGPVQSVSPENLRELIDHGLVCVLSILPVGNFGFPLDRIDPKPKAHQILVTWDDEDLDPERIDYAIRIDKPTLVHCNSGQNRSTALAACWLLKHDKWLTHPSINLGDATAAVVDIVVRARAKTLGAEPRLHAKMIENVVRYAEWLKPRV